MLARNKLYQTESNTIYRILHVFASENVAWVIDVRGANAVPQRKSWSQLQESFKKRDIRLTDLRVGVSQFISTAATIRRELAYAAIEPLVTNPAIFDRQQRAELIGKRIEELAASGAPISQPTLYKHLRNYWQKGQTRDALVADFQNIGLAGSSTTAGRGRPPDEMLAYATYQMTKTDHSNIVRYVRRLKRDYLTLRGAYDAMCDKRYTYADGNGKIFPLPDGERPTFRQFEYRAKRMISLEERLRMKKGKKEFERDHAARVGSALADCLGAGDIYEIDATIADWWLVSRDDPNAIIGKPTLYLIYDRWTRLCVGFYVGLENAAWETAMHAILSIAEDKEELCKRLNIPYDPDDWPAHGLFPRSFLADRGEMFSKNSERICEGLESTISTTPALAPYFKGTVEFGFRTKAAKLSPLAPGYDPPKDQKERRKNHYEQEASLTLEAFTRMIVLAIINHNRSIMKGYRSNPRAILRGVPSIPARLWADDIEHNSGLPSAHSYVDLKYRLMPKGKAVVHAEGVFFSGLFYSSKEFEKKGLLIQAVNRGRFDVDVSYDRRLVDQIVVYDRSSKQSFRCSLTRKSDQFIGYSFAEVKFVMTRDKENSQNQKDEMRKRGFDFRQDVRQTGDESTAALKLVAKGKSRTFRKAGIRQDRLRERRERRSVEAQLLPQMSGALPVAPRGTLPTPIHAEVAVPTSTSTQQPIESDSSLKNPTAPLRLSLADELRNL
jgi:putative transposase